MQLSQSLLQSKEWSRAYLWNFYFTGGPAGFDKWFPATAISSNLAVSTPLAVNYYISNYKVAQNTSQKELQITFVDVIDSVIEQWVLDWYGYIYDPMDGVAILRDSVKMVHYQQLRLDKTVLKHKSYYVIPDGNVVRADSSDADTLQYQLNLTIVGDTSSNTADDFFRF